MAISESDPSPQLMSLKLLCVSGDQTHNANVGVADRTPLSGYSELHGGNTGTDFCEIA